MLNAMVMLHSLIFSVMLVGSSYGHPPESHRRVLPVPPQYRFNRHYEAENDRDEIYERVNSLPHEEQENAWEVSGLFEGDIVETLDPKFGKNGRQNQKSRWPHGIVPVFINKNNFDSDDIGMIEDALEEYHEKTCLRFRAYNGSDSDYVVFQSKEAGCFSSVGRQSKGQVINLQKPKCVRHGTIVHEVMHAVGFYHQQSSSDRDEYVDIIWDNISKGKEHNFKKYDSETVTDYGVGYDYQSIMHYSNKAFSKNGNNTIVPRDETIQIGQRKGLSGKDIIKLEEMYRAECTDRDNELAYENCEIDCFAWLYLNSM